MLQKITHSAARHPHPGPLPEGEGDAEPPSSNGSWEPGLLAPPMPSGRPTYLAYSAYLATTPIAGVGVSASL